MSLGGGGQGTQAPSTRSPRAAKGADTAVILATDPDREGRGDLRAHVLEGSSSAKKGGWGRSPCSGELSTPSKAAVTEGHERPRATSTWRWWSYLDEPRSGNSWGLHPSTVAVGKLPGYRRTARAVGGVADRGRSREISDEEVRTRALH